MKKILILLVIFSIGVFIATQMIDTAQNKKTLEIFNPCKVNPVLVDSSIRENALATKLAILVLSIRIPLPLPNHLLKIK